jgi:hypothetical protein
MKQLGVNAGSWLALSVAKDTLVGVRIDPAQLERQMRAAVAETRRAHDGR